MQPDVDLVTFIFLVKGQRGRQRWRKGCTALNQTWNVLNVMFTYVST